MQSALQPLETFLSSYSVAENLDEFLGCAAPVFSANGAEITIFGPEGVQESHLAGAGADVADQYHAHYHLLNGRLGIIPSLTGVISDETYLDVTTFRRSAFYNWFQTEARANDLLAAIVPLEADGRCAVLSFARDSTLPYYTADDRSALQRLLPVLETNLRLSGPRWGDAPFLAALLEQAAPDTAIAVLNGDLQALAITPAFRAQIPRAGLLPETTGAGLPPGPLEKRIGHACTALRRGAAPVRLALRPHRLDLTISRLTRSSLFRRHELFLLQLAPAVAPLLAQRGRLSPAENEILDALLSGASLGDIAESRQRSYNTIRNQVASIHAKLGTGSILDLVRRFRS